MENLHTEIQELKHFIADLKADRAAQKEKEKKESWTKYTSMSIVFIAVLAAIATQRGGGFSSRVLTNLNNATLSQAQASDQWNYYQAASIKEKLYELADAKETSPTEKATIEKALTKYRQQKDDTQKEGKRLEAERKGYLESAANSGSHSSRMGNVIALFQISIALGSICLVTKKKPLWFISMAMAAAATAYGVYVVWFMP